MNKPRRKNGRLWLAALPLYIFTLIFVLGPLVYMVILSFQKRADVFSAAAQRIVG